MQAALLNRTVTVFLRPNYLTKTLRASDRLRCHEHNFEFLCRNFSPFALVDLFDPGVALFSRTQDDMTVSCKLLMTPKSSNQGEVSLLLSLGPTILYEMGFTFVPGGVFDAVDETVILVSRMQGAPGLFDEIRQATRMVSDVAPQALLFAALQGVAERFGVRLIFGVASRIQLSRTQDNAEQFQRTYDDFFSSLGATSRADGCYRYDRADFADPLANMPAKHRARTKVKRRLKAALAGEVAEALAAHVSETLAASEDYLVAAHFSTHLGQRRANRIVTAGRAGCLMFGPYIYLEAGAYEADYVVEPLSESADFVVDATALRNRKTLARETIAGWRAGDRVTLSFELAEPHEDVEFRLFVKAETELAVRGVVLRRRRP